mmetsp:Transcript_16270/g.40488  ORF Transcript_16270/g.40488 Transcript_16270/m.40488 type:complete len:112 (+) Transcript_16270:259-594(+)
MDSAHGGQAAGPPTCSPPAPHTQYFLNSSSTTANSTNSHALDNTQLQQQRAPTSHVMGGWHSLALLPVLRSHNKHLFVTTACILARTDASRSKMLLHNWLCLASSHVRAWP